MSIESERVAETVEYVALRRLQNRYGDIVTRRAWPELHEIMRPTCTLALDLGDAAGQLDGPGAIGDFIGGQLEQFSFFEFVILNTVVEINRAVGTAGARMYIQELRQNVTDGRRTNAFGVYHDHVERDADGRWWFARRRYGSFSRTQALGPENEQVVFDLPVFALDEL
ncbi:MAG TPA: nuclear transport factor 2 family protein [Acidimicrobiia bacterium]|nr:nuclear transport factor 2 family protein [Acidimicrobiia bacterium]